LIRSFDLMSTIVVKTKPLSNNALWKGRRFKSDAYETYEREMLFLLPRDVEKYRVEGVCCVYYRFYIKTHKVSDVDNLIKGLQDILVKRGFIEDDRYIYRIIAEKYPAQNDRIEVEIFPYVVPESDTL
jgi:Holliday junction resolvase RusA-like endonuclease